MEKGHNLKVLTVLGTRPEIIRLCRVLPALDKFVQHIVVYTGQSFDYEMSEIFFDELELRKPDYILSVKADSLGKQIGNIIRDSEEMLIKEQPDALFVLGDTNSSLCTIIAKRMKIPIFHMEAGNRAFDWDVPEEVNRRIVDHISDINLAYTEHARRHLLAEGLHPDAVYVVGSPYPEIFHHFMAKIDSSNILEELNLESQKYFLVSVHREENVEDDARLKKLFDAFGHLAEVYRLPVIVSLHPRTKKRIDRLGKPNGLIHFHKPFGFLDYVKLEKEALCVISDSGTIPEEAAALNISAVQVRASTERPEALDSGSIVLTGFNRDTIATSVRLVIDDKINGTPRAVPRDYLDLNVSDKVVKLVVGLLSIRKFHDR